MISSLTIKNVTSYDGITGVTISELKKVNFFFGFNGCGKSTIAKYLRNLSLDASQQTADFNNCSNLGYNSSFHQILTFNEDFVEVNFKKTSDFKGVFSLNQSNTAIDQQIEEEEANINNYDLSKNKYDIKIESIENDKRAKNNLLLDYCWNQRTIFSTFTKINLAHSGSKPNHLQEIGRVLQTSITQSLSLQDLIDQYQILYEKELKNITEKINTKAYFSIRRMELQLNKLLQEVIVGNEDVDIARLINTLNSRNWVEQGQRFIKLEDNTCPFCQHQTVNSDLRDQFEKYFDKTYKDKIEEISNLKMEYERQSNVFIQSLINVQNKFNPDNLVSDIVLSLRRLFDGNIRIIDYKIGHSNEKGAITSLSGKKDDLSTILNRIRDNNILYYDLDSEKSSLIKNIWSYMADQCRQEIQYYDDRKIKYDRIIAIGGQLRDRYAGKTISARQNIEHLRGQTVNTKDAVDNINAILKNAGFNGFEIDEKDRVNNISRYYLKRPNSTSTNPIFHSLSEGEKNFISFLYFYQLCLGTDDLRQNGAKKKIIVIDDPVSSLDSQVLFIVSTLIHALIQRKADDNKLDRMLLKNNNIAQVFILTHNIYFYKEISFDRRPICTDFWHYKISKLNNQTSITGNYNKAIFDDYSLMWKTIKNIKSNLPGDSSLNIMISNLMRRIIDSYVNFVGYGKDTWAALHNEDQEEADYYIKCAFISMINDESHKISALDSIYYQKIINEQPQTLFTAFAAIFKKVGKEHYEMMMDEQL